MAHFQRTSSRCQRRRVSGETRKERQAGEEAAEGAEKQAIGRSEARSMDLAFEDAELVTKGENLGPDGAVGLAAEDEEVEEGPDEGVEEPEDHGSRGSRIEDALRARSAT
jgi:hypothetical protein